eukprot:gene7552-10291_t
MSSFTQYSKYDLPWKEIEVMLESVHGKVHGLDTDDEEYHSIVSLWQNQLEQNQLENSESTFNKTDKTQTIDRGVKWYRLAYDYWENEANCPLSDDGVLGGYGKLTPIDVRDSNLFLDELSLQFPSLQFERAADCGAGIGRVSKFFLLYRFSKVDLIEQSPRLLAAAHEYIGEDSKRISCIIQGLQDFVPVEGIYDVIWIQWVIGHLHDNDFIQFFRRCAKGLKPGGIIILKDNVSGLTKNSWTFMLDKTDSSVARHIDYTNLLFQLAGMKVLKQTVQRDFPSELFPVVMSAIVPLESMLSSA